MLPSPAGETSWNGVVMSAEPTVFQLPDGLAIFTENAVVFPATALPATDTWMSFVYVACAAGACANSTSRVPARNADPLMRTFMCILSLGTIRVPSRRERIERTASRQTLYAAPGGPRWSPG